jgi:hypothetical protein
MVTTAAVALALRWGFAKNTGCTPEHAADGEVVRRRLFVEKCGSAMEGQALFADRVVKVLQHSLYLELPGFHGTVEGRVD